MSPLPKKILFYLPTAGSGSDKNLIIMREFKKQGWSVFALSHDRSYLNKLTELGFGGIYCDDFLVYNALAKKIRDFLIHKHLGLVVLAYDYLIFWYLKISLRKKIFTERGINLVFISSDTSYDAGLALSAIPDIKTLVIQFTRDSTGMKELNVVVLPKYFADRMTGARKWFFQHLIKDFLPQYVVRMDGREVIPFKNFYFYLNSILHGIKMTSVRKGGGLSKRLFVNGDAYVEIFSSYGVDKRKIAVTGSPDIDVMVAYRDPNYKKDELEQLKRRINFAATDQIALFFTELLDEKPDRYLEYTRRLFLECKKTIPHFKLIIKKHPKEFTDFDSLNQRYPELFVLGPDGNPELNEQLISLSDICIVNLSTMAFSVLGFAKKLVIYKYPYPTKYNCWYEHIYPEHVFCGDEVEMAEHIKNRLLSKDLQNMDLASWYKNDGKCCERIIAQAQSLLL